MADETMKTRSIRATDEAFNALKEMAEGGKFANQGEAFTALIRLWESEQAKQLIPGRETEIEDFRMHINSLSDIYLKSLQLNVDTDKRVREEYSARMQAQDNTILNLHDQIQIQKNMVVDCQQKFNDQKHELEQKTTEVVRLTKELEEVKSSFADKIEEQGALNAAIHRFTDGDEKKTKELNILQDKLSKNEHLMDNTLAARDALQKQVNDLNSKIRDDAIEHKHAMEVLNIEKDKAVLAEQHKKQERYGILQDKYDALMEKYSAIVGSSQKQPI